jgi:uncharacterized DUF497 family protein
MAETGPWFDWDQGNWNKCQKHGVSIAEIETVFRGQPLVAPDVFHSAAETRFVAIGRNAGGRLVFLIFTMRRRDGEELIPPVSARYMREKELRRYAKGST